MSKASPRRRAQHRYLICASLIAAATMVCETTRAQEAKGQEAGLTEIIVTAQKRAEPLQKTPLAISAVSSDTIQARRISDSSDLNAIAPNIATASGPASRSNLVITIRGIGETDPILTNDSPVGVYVDGVIVGRSAAAIFELVDLERIEVLRGPQGTLYGRNTTGGAVNLITKKPSKDFGLDMTASHGNRGYWQGKGSLDTGEIGDSGFAAKLSFMHRQANGYIDNVNARDSLDPGAYRTDAARAALRFDRGGAFRLDYVFDWSRSKGIPGMAQLTAASNDVIDYYRQSAVMGGSNFIEPSATRRSSASPDITRTYDRNMSHTITAEVELTDDLTVRSITGFRQWKNYALNSDQDGNSGLMGLVVYPGTPGVQAVSLFGADDHRKQHQLSQEINVLGKLGSNFDYVLGGYYFREEATEDNPQYYTVVMNMEGVGLVGYNLTNHLLYSTQSESMAAFGQLIWRFTDKLSLTGGLRYTSDNRKLYQSEPMVRQLSRSFSKLNWAATLTYQPTGDIMAYARITTGYKAGGFNARSVNDGYDPENVTNYELGLKSEFFNHRLRFNGSVFYSDLKNKQLTQFAAGTGGASSQTINAGRVTFTGVEAEIEAMPVIGLQLNASLGYTRPKFKELLAIDPTDDVTKNYASIAHLGQAPSTTANAGAQYTIEDVAQGRLSFRIDYTYKSKQYYNVIPAFSPYDDAIAAKGYGLLDGRIMLADVPLGTTSATFTLWSKNLMNKTYRAGGIDFGSLGFAMNIYGEPRSFGADVRLKF